MNDHNSKSAAAILRPKARLLFATNSSSLGGAALALLSELERLPKERFTLLVVVPENGPLVDALARVGIRTEVIYQPWWTTSGTEDAWLYSMRLLPEAIARMREVILRENIDLVCTNTSVIPSGALAAALELRSHVWRPHEFVGQGTCRGPLEASTIRGCMTMLSNHIAAGSEILAREFIGDGLVAKVVGVFSGIDCSLYEHCSPDWSGRTILSIAATTPSKGLEDLVEAAVLLNRRGVGYSVVVVGAFDHESYRQQILKKLRTAQIANRFELAGYQKDLLPFLNRASVYCCPSHTEAMSRVVVEAMAAGLPVVATDCGGPRDLVEEGTTGMLVPVKDPEALANALEQMLADPGRRTAMGKAGRRRASERFDLKATVPSLVEVLEAAIQAPPAAQARPFAQLILNLLETSGPRILLGKKWKLLRLMEQVIRR